MRPDTWLVIINPASAGGKGKRRWPRLKKALEERNIPFHYEFSENADDFPSLLNEGYEKGIRNFGILGGDGSLNLLLNSVMKLGWPLDEVRFALFPAGTGNDWRRTHKIQDDPEHVVRLIADESYVPHDIGRIDTSKETYWFINVLGAGLDAKAVEVYHKRTWKWPVGKLKYVFALLIALMGYRRASAKVLCDQKEIFSGKFLNLNLAIGSYSGGGMHTVPHANFRGGKLELVLVPKIPFLKILINLPGLFNGKYVRLKEVKTFSGERITIQFDQPNPVEADGEMMGRSEEYGIQIIPGALKVISALN